jgi:hypothetical protein
VTLVRAHSPRVGVHATVVAEHSPRVAAHTTVVKEAAPPVRVRATVVREDAPRVNAHRTRRPWPICAAHTRATAPKSTNPTIRSPLARASRWRDVG